MPQRGHRAHAVLAHPDRLATLAVGGHHASIRLDDLPVVASVVMEGRDVKVGAATGVVDTAQPGAAESRGRYLRGAVASGGHILAVKAESHAAHHAIVDKVVNEIDVEHSWHLWIEHSEPILPFPL